MGQTGGWLRFSEVKKEVEKISLIKENRCFTTSSAQQLLTQWQPPPPPRQFMPLLQQFQSKQHRPPRPLYPEVYSEVACHLQ